jgi:hypothetical protein
MVATANFCFGYFVESEAAKTNNGNQKNPIHHHRSHEETRRREKSDTRADQVMQSAICELVREIKKQQNVRVYPLLVAVYSWRNRSNPEALKQLNDRVNKSIANADKYGHY